MTELPKPEAFPISLMAKRDIPQGTVVLKHARVISMKGDEVIERADIVVAAVGRAETERTRLKQPGNLDAWDTCQRGLWHLQRFTREDFAARETAGDPVLARELAGMLGREPRRAAF
jgi:hypothetical protein